MKSRLALSLALILGSAAAEAAPLRTITVELSNDSSEPVGEVFLDWHSAFSPEPLKRQRLPLAGPLLPGQRTSLTLTMDQAGATDAGMYYGLKWQWAGDEDCSKGARVPAAGNQFAIATGKAECEGGLAPAQYHARKLPRLLEQARAAHGAGEHEEAEDLYSEALAIDPRNEAALHGRGHSRMQDRSFEAAAADFSAALARSNDPAHLHFDRGGSRIAQQKWREALPDFNRAVALKPDNGQYLAYRVATLCKAGDVAAAKADVPKLRSMGVKLGDDPCAAPAAP